MATKRKLVNDPNVPFDDGRLVSRFGLSQQDSYNAGRELGARMQGEPVQEAPRVGWPRPPAEVQPAPAAPQRRSVLTDEQLNEAQDYGRQAGAASAGYLGERKALAPGVRRWASKTADPSDVYMSVDKNGNRVYTDDADFAASQSRGRLTRRDLAPGMLASDADRTLNDPEGGFTYAPAPGKALDGLRQASARTRGGSQTIERALAEATRAQEIADTRAGTRPIDERRRTDGTRLRRSLGLETEGNVDPRTLIALERLNLDKQKFSA
jgi:hypothetical protein